jgi:Kef-type K+ transport system membrane component KefB
MLPDPQKRFIKTLFLGTALSISSVKIVAMVVRTGFAAHRRAGHRFGR